MDSTTDTSTQQTTKTRTAPSNALNVLIYAPFKTYYDGLASSVTAKNGTGVFDVLPGHHSFISLIDPGYITINTSKGEQQVRIEKGLMHVTQNLVTVFLDV